MATHSRPVNRGLRGVFRSSVSHISKNRDCSIRGVLHTFDNSLSTIAEITSKLSSHSFGTKPIFSNNLSLTKIYLKSQSASNFSPKLSFVTSKLSCCTYEHKPIFSNALSFAKIHQKAQSGTIVTQKFSFATSNLTSCTFGQKPIFPNAHFLPKIYLDPQHGIISSPKLSIGLHFNGPLSSRSLISSFPLKSPLLGSGLRGNAGTVGLTKISGHSFGARIFAFRSYGVDHFDRKFAKFILQKPVSAIKMSLQGYREAIGLHMEAFWKRYSLVLVGATGVALCMLLWRVMFGIANTFVGLSEGMAKYGFLALAMAIVSFLGIFIRQRFAINPERVYRLAMRKLNTSAGILEVMGAPLTGTDIRAYVMAGGGIQLKNFRLRFGRKRCFLIFPIQGSERKGLVTVEIKKKKGQYDVRLLAVDVPTASGHDQRLFLIGDEQEYQIGGGLISELRDPIVKAMAAEKEFDALDQKEEDDDRERELLEREKKHRKEMDKLERREQGT